jgi:hypothetical protein
MGQDMNGAQQGTMKDELKQAITQLGLDYRIMTQFTSFVAVEEMIVTDGGQPRRIDVPVEVPEGVNRAAVYNESVAVNRQASSLYLMSPSPGLAKASARTRTARGSGGGVYSTGRGGVVGGSSRSQGGGGTGGGGVGSGTVVSPSPAPPPKPSTVNGVAMVVDGSDADTARIRSPEEQKRADMQAKLHPSILKVIDWLKAPKAGALSDEAKFVRDGKAEIQIFLTDKSDATMAELKKLGFEVILDPKTAKMVIGRLPIEKLAALSDLKFVRYVAPQVSN